jgi:membrane-associated phospholipid phosphatase
MIVATKFFTITCAPRKNILTILRSFRSSWRSCKRGIRTKGLRYLGLWLAFSLCSGLLLLRYDEQAVLSATQFGSGWFTAERLKFAARLIHEFGDFEFFIVGLSFTLFLLGKVCSNSYFPRIASCLFIAGAISGVGVQVVKFAVGRPRPPLVQQGKARASSFTGPNLSPKYRSYPSGHSTCVATACTVLVLALPRLMPLAVIVAMVAGASRVVYNYHFPTDVLSGLALGMAVGGMCSIHLIRLRRRLVRKGQWLTALRQNHSSTQELSAADHP